MRNASRLNDLDLIEAEDMIQVHIYRMEQIQQILDQGEVQKQLKVNV